MKFNECKLVNEMADNKKSFILYADLKSVVEKLITKDREDGTNNSGELFFHILEYVNDMHPEPKNFIVEMSFEPIKLQLKRDSRKYEEVREKNRQNALSLMYLKNVNGMKH